MEAKRRAQAELYWQARLSNAVPLGPATYRSLLGRCSTTTPDRRSSRKYRQRCCRC